MEKNKKEDSVKEGEEEHLAQELSYVYVSPRRQSRAKTNKVCGPPLIAEEVLPGPTRILTIRTNGLWR